MRQPDLGADMHVDGNKRLRLQNEDKSNFGMSKDFVSGLQNEKMTQKVIDFSDGFALKGLLQELDGGNYGSVSKDCERIHAQRMQVMTFFSALQFANTCSIPVPKPCGSGLNSLKSSNQSNGYKSHNVIDLDTDLIASDPVNFNSNGPLIHTSTFEGIHQSARNMSVAPNSYHLSGNLDHQPENKDSKEKASVILLDSDDEGAHPAQIVPSTIEDKASDLLARIESHLRKSRISRDGYSKQLVSYESSNCSQLARDAVIQPDRQPLVNYEKVFLQPASQSEKVILTDTTDYRPIQHLVGDKHFRNRIRQPKRKRAEAIGFKAENNRRDSDENGTVMSSPNIQSDLSHVGTHDNNGPETPKSDGLDDLWKDMSFAMECSKTATSDAPAIHNEEEEEEECDHSFVLEDDIGLVCRVCGVIRKSIETIFDYQWLKGTRTTRSSMQKLRSSKDQDESIEYSGPKIYGDIIAADISIHPRHLKQMKPHQIEGFNFLVRNLVTDKPGGCILAHAPGSGKTFMLISFIQSFLTKYPHARPLVVLPKGIVSTWKKEFQRWQVEYIPLYDFYSLKADNRYHQLEVLQNWEDNKSILFMGYKQFANIISSSGTSKIDAACQERLLKVTSLLIIDEGHTPRNEDTNMLSSLLKVQTPRKVVLSGTLFQNHVKEVFNILNLVRPNFVHTEYSRPIVKRVLSRVKISGGSRVQIKGGKFLDLVEDTLRNDDNYKRKVAVIQDLRELTQNVLHYYKGDFLEELPGLVDYTVLLELSHNQKQIVKKLWKGNRMYTGKFKKNAVGSAIYVHPYLQNIMENAAADRINAFNDAKVDEVLDSLDVKDGVKTKFFLNILSMAEAAGEKLLVFSQYLIPMKFLERLLVRLKGWRVGKEIFMITGDSNSEEREWSMDQFNNSADAKVLFGSIKACGEGISLVGASRVVILDVHLNPSVTRQAIGRAFRPGQEKKVYAYRLVAADTEEEEDQLTSFRKELMSKMWFEWSEYCGHDDFELQEVKLTDCQDTFLESPNLAEDVKKLYRR